MDAEDYFIKSVQSGQPWQKAATICGIAHEKAREILDRGQIMHTTPVVDDLSRVEEFNRMLDEAEPKAVRALIEIAEHGKPDSARVAASNALLDRKRGKPVQQQVIDATIKSASEVQRELLALMTDDQIKSALRIIDIGDHHDN